MKQYGKLKLNFVGIDDIGYGDRVEKILNIYTDNSSLPVVYVNVESCKQEQTYDNGATWNLIGETTEQKYDVYVNKELNDVITLYKTNSYFDTETWISAMGEIA